MGNMGSVPSLSFADLQRYVLIDIVGASDILQQQQIQAAVSKFIRISECWRDTLDLGNLSGGYIFDIPKPTSTAENVDSHNDPLDGTEIPAGSGGGTTPLAPVYDAFPKIPLRWVKIDGVEVKSRFYRINPPLVKDGPYTMQFLAPFNIIGNGQVSVRLAWRLRFDADPAPEWIYEQYGDIIATICRGAFLTMVGKPWSSKNEGPGVKAEGVAQAMRVLAEMNLSDQLEFRP